MEKRDNGKVIAVIALFVAVIGLSVGFATLSTQLQINGGATVKAANWDLNFGGKDGEGNEEDKPKNPDPTGTTGKAEQVDEPVFSDTSVTFHVSVKAPGDKISYKFKVANDGGIDAKVSAKPVTTFSGTCTTTNPADDTNKEEICGKIKVTLLDADTKAEVKQGDQLPAGEGKHYIWVLTFDEDYELTADKLPQGDITLNGITTTVNYVQDEAA